MDDLSMSAIAGVSPVGVVIFDTRIFSDLYQPLLFATFLSSVRGYGMGRYRQTH
jgi:hypothetical protein